MSYGDAYMVWEAEQKLSPASPEAFYAEKAWNAAIRKAIETVQAIENVERDQSWRIISEVILEELDYLDTKL